MSSLDEELLSEDPNSLAIDADEDAVYEPHSDSQVVAVEPKIITLGREKRKRALRNLQNPAS